MRSHVVADRGQVVELENKDGNGSGQMSWVVAARLGSLRLAPGASSFWMQLRGCSQVSAREGAFRLERGDWLALERDSSPVLQSDRDGVAMGLVLGPDPARSLRWPVPLPGRGRMCAQDLRLAVRLWRRGADDTLPPPSAASAMQGRTLSPMLLHIARLQGDLSASLRRCPGRSTSRKRQVFGRLQRAHLFLQGNCHRVVRLTELAELTSFSSWYLSKTFHSLYEESPQAVAARLRLERACELLLDTDWSISEIGVSCGFDNSCSFARAFRARYCMTASQYRRRMRNATPGSATRPGLPRNPLHALQRNVPGR